jgi:hypothetical protein
MADPPRDERSELAPRPPTSNPTTSATSSVSGTDPAILREFLDVAKRDIEIRQQEVELQRQEKANTYEYSKLALDAQVADRKDERKDKRSERLEKMGFALAGAIVLAAFMVTSMYMGHEQVALEAMKNLGLILIAGYGGYQYAARKFSKESGNN